MLPRGPVYLNGKNRLPQQPITFCCRFFARWIFLSLLLMWYMQWRSAGGVKSQLHRLTRFIWMTLSGKQGWTILEESIIILLIWRLSQLATKDVWMSESWWIVFFQLWLSCFSNTSRSYTGSNMGDRQAYLPNVDVQPTEHTPAEKTQRSRYRKFLKIRTLVFAALTIVFLPLGLFLIAYFQGPD